MEIKILNEKDNRLLKRKEYEAVIFHNSEPTPKRIEVRDRVAALANAEPERTVVCKIDTEFGWGHSKLTFRVYDNPEIMKQIELAYLLKRNGHIEEKKEE